MAIFNRTWPLSAILIASDTSIEVALEPVKFFEGIGKGGCDFGSRFAIQPLCLNEPSTGSRIPEGASQVSSGLGVVVRALPTRSVTSGNRQPSESDFVHDHIRLRAILLPFPLRGMPAVRVFFNLGRMRLVPTLSISRRAVLL